MPKNILIVDDEKDIVSFVRDFFTDEGYEVFTAFNGEEAKKVIESQEPALVILDMKMPGIDGPEILKIVNNKCPSSKVVILTGYAEEYSGRLKGLRYDGFITKPFSAIKLVNTAQDILSGKVTVKTGDVNLYNDSHIMPKSRLLFIEPNELAIAGKKVYFSNREKSGGEYEIELITRADEIEAKLKEFKPDIILADVTVLTLNKNLRLKIMKSEFRPKDIVVFGWSADEKGGEDFIKGEFDPMTAVFVKDMMDKLGKVVREICITNKLYVKSEESVRIPGLKVKSQRMDKKKEVKLEDIPDMLKSIISEHMNIPKDNIKDNTNLIKDLDMSTLQGIQINVDLEDDLGFEIPDGDLDKLRTFKHMVDYLQKRFNTEKQN